MDQCQHLIAGDCSYRKTFAVLARSLSNNDQQKEVEIVSGWTKINLSQQLSGSGQINVKVNGSSIGLPTQANQPLYIQDLKKDLIAIIYK